VKGNELCEGRRVLVVEDEALIAFDLEAMLTDAGIVVVGPVATLDAAISAAKTATVDAALLDVSLARQLVWPAAEILQRRNIPFLFLTGFAGHSFPEAFASCVKLEKPCTPEILISRFSDLFAA